MNFQKEISLKKKEKERKDEELRIKREREDEELRIKMKPMIPGHIRFLKEKLEKVKQRQRELSRKVSTLCGITLSG